MTLRISQLLIGIVLIAASSLAAAAQSIMLKPDTTLDDYRTVGVEISLARLEAGQTLALQTNDVLHSEILIGDVTGLERQPIERSLHTCLSDGLPIHRTAEGQAIISATTATVSCAINGLRPGSISRIRALIRSERGAVLERSVGIDLIAAAPDVRLLPPDTRPVLIVLGGIFLSIVALLSGLRWWEAVSGRSKSKNAYFYIGPAILALALLTFYPIVYGIWLAFTDANQTHLGQSEFVGVRNFFDVFASSGLVQVSLFTLAWTVVNVFFHVVLGLAIALILNRQKLIGRGVYRTILLLPWAVPAYISVLAWQGLLQPEGLVNAFLGANANYLGEATSARISVTLVNIWLGVPFMMMSLAGAMKAIPTDMYEAADLDGVSRWHQFRHITFPNLKSTLVPLSLLSFIWTFNMFNTIYLLTRGGPYLGFGKPGATDIMVTYIYDVAFEYGDYGLAAAWSVIVFLLLLAFSIFYVKQTRATEAST